MKNFTVRFKKADFTRDGNPLYKEKRIQDTELRILLVWINRHIVRAETIKNSEWFGGSDEGDFFEFWFKLEDDMNRACVLLNDVIKLTIPKTGKYY